MKFSEMVDQASEFLRRRERISYRALKREFDLDDEALADLKVELIDAQRIAIDEEGKVLIWAGSKSTAKAEKRSSGESQPSPCELHPCTPRRPHSCRAGCARSAWRCRW